MKSWSNVEKYEETKSISEVAPYPHEYICIALQSDYSMYSMKVWKQEYTTHESEEGETFGPLCVQTVNNIFLKLDLWHNFNGPAPTGYI